MERVREMMTADPPRVAPDTPLGDCAARLLGSRGSGEVRVLVVMDGDEVVGLLTDACVFGRGRFEGGRWSFGAQTADQAALPAFTLQADGPAAAGVRKLTGRDVAVVLDADRRVVGLASEHDAVRLAPALIPAFRAVGEIASRPVATVLASAPALDAWEDLRGAGRRHVVVTDREGRATDVLSLRDLVRAGIRPDDERTVRDVCPQTALHGVDLDDPVQDAARRMAEVGVGCLPSLDADGRPVAILTRSDILRVLAQTLADPVLFGPTELFALARALRGPDPEPALERLARLLPAQFQADDAANGRFSELGALGCPEAVLAGFRVQRASLTDTLAGLRAAGPAAEGRQRALIHFANALEAHAFEVSRAHLQVDPSA